MKSTFIAVLVCAVGAFSAQAYSFKIKVNLGGIPEKKTVRLPVPKGAEKASARYFRLAEKTHPLLLSHNFAAPPGQPKLVKEDDPLDDLVPSAVDDDLIQKVDKDVEYVVRTTDERNSFVLMIVNRKNKDLTAEVELKLGKMREPVYRRVYSEDDGKSWTTIAWQPPRESNLYPWPIEVPANTVQTVTICLK